MKHLLIEVSGSGDAQAFLTEKLRAGLASHPQFRLTSSTNEADTKLEVSVEPVRDRQPKTAQKHVVTVRLVNVESNVIWPRNTNGRQYRGLLPDISQKVLQDLHLAVEQK